MKIGVRKVIVAVAGAILIVGAWQAWGWRGVLLVSGAIVMYLLLQFNRLMTVLSRAAKNPKGYVGSAVMLNAKLKAGVNLMHVMALTQSIGEALSAEGEEPEVFRWTDGTQSSVTCEFANGSLTKWTLERPSEPAADPAAPTGK